MIDGYFDGNGSLSFLPAWFCSTWALPGRVHFLVDTGTDATILHPEGATRLNCPFDDLENPVEVTSAGGPHTYYAEAGQWSRSTMGKPGMITVLISP